MVSTARRAAAPATALLLLSLAPALPAAAPVPALVVLTVGGGPKPSLNQVAIENNVRYVDGLLPAGAERTVLFGDGKADSAIVLYEDPAAVAKTAEARRPAAERAFEALFGAGPASAGAPKESAQKLRAPRLRAIDGPAQRESIGAAFDRLAAHSADAPYLVYFTGHGDRERSDLDNNSYALWADDKGLAVRELAAQVAKLPKGRPVTLVMVQCYSGAFANVLFENGDPKGSLADRPLCGFFSTTRERMAAGCTPEVNEANYRDFTSYFFAALSGRDRTGKAVPAPDYDKDGRVGMHEAFAYANIHEPSIDVPVATSDVFLRRFVSIPDDEVVGTPYSKVLALASPAQRAALEGISRALGETGQDRLKAALDEVRAGTRGAGGGHDETFPSGDIVAARGALADARTDLVNRFPRLQADLRQMPAEAFDAEIRKPVVEYLAGKPDTAEAVLRAAKAFEAQGKDRYEQELRAARCLRLVRIAKSVLLEDRLRRTGDKALVARFDALEALERGNPLRPAVVAKR